MQRVCGGEVTCLPSCIGQRDWWFYMVPFCATVWSRVHREVFFFEFAARLDDVLFRRVVPVQVAKVSRLSAHLFVCLFT